MIILAVCSTCGLIVFPPRLLCPRCAGSDFGEVEVDHATLTSWTEHREVRVALVRTRSGAHLVVRLAASLADPVEDEVVALDMDGGVPTAARRPAAHPDVERAGPQQR